MNKINTDSKINTLIRDFESNYFIERIYYSVRMDGEFYELSAGNSFDDLEDAKQRASLIKDIYPNSKVTINLSLEVELFEWEGENETA